MLLGECLREQLGLALRAREPVQDPVLLAERQQLVAHEPHHRRVRHQLAAADHRVCLAAQLGLLADVLPQQVAGRHQLDAVALDEP